MEKIIKVTDIPEPTSMRWNDGLPIGNGKLGAMVSGFIPVEFMSLNDDTLWYGPYRKRERSHSFEYIEKIRDLLSTGKVKEADKLCYMAMTSTPKYYGAYQPMGELDIFFNHGDDAKNYEKSLNLETGIATVSYEVDSMHVKRECFVSYPDNVLVMHITADKSELDIHFNMMRRPCDEGTTALEDDILCMSGHCGYDGLYFECMLTAQTDGKLTRIGDFFGVEKASEITILVSAESEFRTKKVRESALDTLKKAKKAGYIALLENHVKDFSEIFNRSSLDFMCENNNQTKERIREVKNGKYDSGYKVLRDGDNLLAASSVLAALINETAQISEDAKSVTIGNVKATVGDSFINVNEKVVETKAAVKKSEDMIYLPIEEFAIYAMKKWYGFSKLGFSVIANEEKDIHFELDSNRPYLYTVDNSTHMMAYLIMDQPNAEKLQRIFNQQNHTQRPYCAGAENEFVEIEKLLKDDSYIQSYSHTVQLVANGLLKSTYVSKDTAGEQSSPIFSTREPWALYWAYRISGDLRYKDKAEELALQMATLVQQLLLQKPLYRIGEISFICCTIFLRVGKTAICMV